MKGFLVGVAVLGMVSVCLGSGLLNFGVCRVGPDGKFTAADPLEWELLLLTEGALWKTPQGRNGEIPLFRESRTEPPSIHCPKEPPTFWGLPGDWVVENGLDYRDPELPSKDPDSDGYSNVEEYRFETDPKNPTDHPTYRSEFEFVQRLTQTTHLRWEPPFDKSTFQLRLNGPTVLRQKAESFQLGDVVGPAELLSLDYGVLKARDTWSGRVVKVRPNETTTFTRPFAELKRLTDGSSFYVGVEESFEVEGVAYLAKQITERRVVLHPVQSVESGAR